MKNDKPAAAGHDDVRAVVDALREIADYLESHPDDVERQADGRVLAWWPQFSRSGQTRIGAGVIEVRP